MAEIRLDSEASLDQSGSICASIVAKFHNIAIEPEVLAHKQGKPSGEFKLEDISLSLRDAGLQSKVVKAPKKLESLPFPIITQKSDGGFFIVAGIKEGKSLIKDPLEKDLKIINIDKLFELWTGFVILSSKKEGLLKKERSFGISWFIPAILKHKKLFAEVLIASFFVQLFALITPLFFQVVIDKVLVHRSITTLNVLAIGLIAIAFFEVILTGLRTYILSHTTNRIDVLLGSKLFKHMLNLPLSYFQARRVGDSVARVRELDSLRNFLTGSAITLTIDVLFTFVFLSVLYYYSPLLTLVVAASIPLYFLLSYFIAPLLRNRLDEKFKKGAENQAFLVETITGVETLKSMSVEPQWNKKWEDRLANYVKSSFDADTLSNITNQSASFINKLTVAGILWIGATLVINGELSVGQLIAFNMIAARISGPILRFVQLWQDFQQAGISLNRLGDILNSPEEPGTERNYASAFNIKGEVSLNNLSFSYRPGGQDILKSIDLTIPCGSVIGVVGKSGSGKSTIAKLIQRLYSPNKGEILIDGINLNTVNPASLRRQIGYVPQESELFNMSVRDNIALSNEGLPLDSIIGAAKLAGAHEFIAKLPEGYETVIGEHGSNLSGGQKQRLAIARALATNPKILILDEATSALDYESEHAIQKNMRAICKGRTVIIIAHRLSTVRGCDNIYILNNGAFVESGDHADLLSQNGHYARLFALQQGVAQ